MTSAETLRGWFAVLCLHVATFLWVGNIKGLGVMLPTLTEQFTAQTWLMGWMVSIVAGVICLTGPLASPLESVFGTRVVIMASGFVIGVSFIAASFATSVAQITLILALGCGSGLSFTNILSRAMMGRCFTTNYAIAVGIGHAGSPLGLIIMAPLIQLFLDTYGWRGTMLLLGGINLNIAVCGALLCQPSTRGSQEVKYTPVPSSVEECKTKPRGIFLKETLMTIKTRSGISVCFKLSFWIPTFIFICNGTTGILWFAYFIDHAQAKGFTAYDAVLFTTVGGLANVIVKILTGPIIDRGILSLRAALVIYTLAASVCLIVDPWMNSYWLMVVNVFILYGSLGTVGALDILTRELVGPELLANAFSWMKFVSGVAFFCSGFFPGWIYDTVGSYDVAFVIMGLTPALSLVALLVERLRPTDKIK